MDHFYSIQFPISTNQLHMNPIQQLLNSLFKETQTEP